MATRCKFGTCACVVEWEEPLTDYNRQAKFIFQCRTHDTPREALDHNGQTRLNDPNDPAIQDKQNTERKKPEFQRR